MYAPGMGRFLTRDTWSGDANKPMSLNRWAYTEGNPINSTDPTGNNPKSNLNYCLATTPRVSFGADLYGLCFVEEYMKPNPSDYVNTYVAAGVAIESNWYFQEIDTRGSLWFWWNAGIGVGLGICNISDAQMETPYGDPIVPGDRSQGFGLGLRVGFPPGQGPNQEDPEVAILGMRLRISQVLEKCKRCSPTDEFIAAALAEGSNLNKDGVATLIEKYQRDPNDPIQNILRWKPFLLAGSDYDHNLRQIRLFHVDILELQKRNRDWFVPADISWQYIIDLGNGVAR
jgi:hypothetical protein